MPEAVSNYLLRLGWGHGDDEIISRDQAIEWFDLDHVGKSPSRFDFKKLENLNGHYIREADDARLAELVAPQLGASRRSRRRCWSGRCPSSKPGRMTSIELADGARFLFASRPLAMDESGGGAAHAGSARPARSTRMTRLLLLPNGTQRSVEAAIREVAEGDGVKLGKLAQPLRAALTGRTTSPGIFDVLALLGRDESLARIADQMVEPNE